MTSRHAALMTIALLCLLAGARPAPAAPGCVSCGLSFPLDGIMDYEDFAARSLSGGCWLAGLPDVEGLPRYNGRNVHAGIDLRAQLDDTVYAVAPGVVEATSDVIHSGYGPGWTPGYALLVRTTAPGGGSYVVVYGHTREHLVHGGDTVAAGQAIARVGPWLAADGGPHLHLTVRLGDLPRFGWGTPTAGSVPGRDGAEAAATALEVVRLGYRDPRWLLAGDVDRELTVGVDGEGVRHEELVRRYFDGFAAAESEAACTEVANTVGQPQGPAQRWANGLRQDFVATGGETGALLLGPGAPAAYWVHGPVWQAYLQAGGAARLGFPIAEQWRNGEAVGQAFQRGTVVWRQNSGPMIVGR